MTRCNHLCKRFNVDLSSNLVLRKHFGSFPIPSRVRDDRCQGQRILSPVIAALPGLTKRYKASIFAPSGRQGIASAGFVSTRPATILAPSLVRVGLDLGSLFQIRGSAEFKLA